MFEKLVLSFLFIGFIVSVEAQDTPEKETPKKEINQYVSVQANQLIKQLLNFSGSTAVINNPYLLTYSVNSSVTGWGASFGLGYTFNEFSDGDVFQQRFTRINELFFRVGFDKRSTFGKRWLISRGIDVVVDQQHNKTRNVQSGTGSFTTKNETSGWGLGPRVTLYFYITDTILVGTEANYYFKSIKSTLSSDSQFSVDDKTEQFKRFQFNAPAVIFLTLKF